MAHHVFISYAAEDKPAADAVCVALERRQIPCWIAPRDARPGLDYADSIVDALDETSVMVFVVSSRSIASPHVKREVEQAANRGMHVIPFRIEDVELSRGLGYFLGTVHWIDALTPPIDKQLEYLGDSVQYFLERKAASSAAQGQSPTVPPSAPPIYDTAPTPSRDWSVAAEPIEAYPAAPEVVPPVQPDPWVATGAAAAAPPAFSPDVTSPPWSAEVPAAPPNLGAELPASAARVTWPADAAPALGLAQTRPPRLWLIVLCGTLGAVLGSVPAIALMAVGGLPAYLYVPPLTPIIVPAIVTWAWFYTLRKRTLSPAAAGGLGGLIAAWLGARGLDEFYSRFGTAQILGWVVFGIAGGFAIERGHSGRPAVTLAIALVCAALVRPLILGQVESLAVDMPIAIGWGLGLIACPDARAALRQAQASRAAAAGEANS